MAPGQKKKGRQNKTDNKHESLKNDVNCSGNEKDIKNVLPEKNVEPSPVVEEGSTKYQKGVITSNWQRYDEPEIDVHADVIRGRTFDVLLSYCNSAGSQLQLQEEKTWEDGKMDDQEFVLDLNRLTNVYKCIPLHKQLHLSDDLFDYNQLMRLQKCADNIRGNFQSSRLSSVTDEQASKKLDSELVIDDQSKFLHIVDCWDANDTDEQIEEKQPLAEETGNLIQSLTSCLLLKDDAEPRIKIEPKIDVPDPSTKDDLDFLLTLCSPQEALVSTEDKKISVDDWLNNILDS